MEFLVGLLVLVLILIGLASSSGKHHAERVGARGERKVIRVLGSKLDPEVYCQFHDLSLPVGNDTTQIDHVVVSPYGVFVIETKNYSGWIFGDSRSRVWTQTFRQSKHKFQNPLRQNYKHTKAIESFLSLPAEYVHSVVVFVGSADFRTDRPANVVYLRELPAYILAHRERVLLGAGYDRIINLLTWHKQGVTAPAAHPERSQHLPKEPKCPFCGCKMKERVVREGSGRGNRFWGCARFPYCRATRPME